MVLPDSTTKKYSVRNAGDIFGNICKTRNLNFDKEGYLGLAMKARAFYREASSGADLDQVLAFVFSDVGDLVFSSDGIFDLDMTQTGSGAAMMVKNNDSGVQSGSIFGDALAWNARIYHAGATTTKYWDGATWSSASITLTSGVPHPMAIFESLNYLAVATAKNVIKLYDTSHSLQATLTIPDFYEIQWIVYREQNLYIGTRNTVGGIAKLFVWNGATTGAQRAYSAKGAENIMSGCEYANGIAVVTNLGQVLWFNGGGFDVLDNFPVFYSDQFKWCSTNDVTKMARRGMIADGDSLLINIQGHVTDGHGTAMLPNQPSGLWQYDPGAGLYHKASGSFDYPTFVAVNAVNASTDTITLASGVETQTGEPILYSQSASVIGGITTNRVYYAIRVNSTNFKFAKTFDDAINGVAIDITSDPGVYTGKLACVRGEEFGTAYNASMVAGAVAIIPESRDIYNFYMNRILWGIWRVTGDSFNTEYSAVMSFVPGENRGHFVTTKFLTQDIEEMWKNILTKMRGIYSTNDKAIVKYRVLEKQFFPLGPVDFILNAAGITWTSTTTFTATSYLFQYVVEGDEIEIVSGAGTGITVHISTITLNAGTYTVTIDETLPLITNADTSLVVIENWTKLGILSSTSDPLHKKMTVDRSSKWIQIKIELRGDVQVEENQTFNSRNLPAKS